MTEPRRSTVYDYSDLRLHPDGSRVYQKDSNRQLWLANKVVQTANQTWIATDAGGSVKVPKFRGRGKKKVLDAEEEGEDFDFDDDNGSGGEKLEEGTTGDEEDQSGQKRKLKKKVDGRTIKRRKFLEDYSFLGSGDETKTASLKPGTSVEQQSTPLPYHDPFPFEPSADLLKFIHRFAAEYYTERGDLLNISREYRKQRKARRLERLAKAKMKKVAKTQNSKQDKGKGKAADRPEEDSDPDQENEDEEEQSSSSSEEEGDENGDDDDVSTDSESDDHLEGASGKADKGEGKSTKIKKGEKGVKKRLRWKGRKRAEMLYKDMYKMFDGSALLALGMLVQEQIAYSLMSQPPEGWEDEVKRTYGTHEAGDDVNDVGPRHRVADSLQETHEENQAAGNIDESDTGGQPNDDSQAEQHDDDGQNNPEAVEDPEAANSPQSARSLGSEES